jgi:DNA-binding PadR family transcriptional regulator
MLQSQPPRYCRVHHLPRTLTEEILQKLYREKLIEVRQQKTVGATRYAMLDHGWDRLSRLLQICRLRRRGSRVPQRYAPDAAAIDSF